MLIIWHFYSIKNLQIHKFSKKTVTAKASTPLRRGQYLFVPY